MNRHRVILGWLFFGVALLVSVLVIFALRNYFGNAEAEQTKTIIKAAMVVAALFCAAGLSLLFDSRFSTWICLPFSALILFSFPIGTLLGGYYFWYYWKYLYKLNNGASS